MKSHALRPLVSRRAVLRMLGTLAGAGVMAPAHARWVEPYLPEVTEHTVFLPDLPLEYDGLRIAHLTDLHRGPVTPEDAIARALSATAALDPDAVVLTGDFVHNHHRDAAPLARLLAEHLRPRLGLWACLGNHDYGSDAARVSEALTRFGGVRVLRNEADQLLPGLYLAGIDDHLRGRPDPAATVAGIPPAAAVVYLTHNPVGVFAVDRRPWLVLAGHTHGGQIRIPFTAPHFPPGMEGFPLIAGWGIFDQARLYINRGVGMGMVPLRLFCRPEVALFTLRRGDGLPVPAPGLAVRAFRKARRVAGDLKRKF